MWKYSFKRLFLYLVTICFLTPPLSAIEWKFQDYPGSVSINNRLQVDLDYKSVAIEEEFLDKTTTTDRTNYATNGLFEVIVLPKRKIKNDLEASGEIELAFNTVSNLEVARANMKISDGKWYGKLGKEELPDAYILGLDILVESALYSPSGYAGVDVTPFGFTVGYQSGDNHFQFFVPYHNEGSQHVLGARPFLETKFGEINFVGAIESQTKRSQIDKETKEEGKKAVKDTVETTELSGFGLTVFATLPLTAGGTEIGISYAAKEEITETQLTKKETTDGLTYGIYGTFKLTAERWIGLATHFSSDHIETESGSDISETDKSGLITFVSYHQTIGKGTALRFGISTVSATVEPKEIDGATPKQTSNVIGARMRWVERF